MTLNKALLQEMIDGGFVVVNKHPEADLYIYNYSQTTQFNRVWNEVTLLCRGLILDGAGNIVARPFGKFFNLGEMENQHIPDEPFEVFEKMDGSLGILYWHNNDPYIATRGSFISEQSAKANEILKTKYAHTIGKLDKSKTYLFEIIYPENRIVVDYGDMEDLVMLTVIDLKTGKEEELHDVGIPMVRRYDGVKDIHSLKGLEENNKEGFVIRFSGGIRYKVKFEEYVRIHRIVTGVSSISIWEYLKEGKTLDELLERVPDEFYKWVKKTNDEFHAAYKEIEAQAKADFKVLEDRKTTALYFMTCKYPSVLFQMLDNKEYAHTIWRMLRPEYSRPFSNYDETNN